MREKTFQDLFIKLVKLGREGITMNHYDLYEEYPETSLEEWRAFLKDPQTQAYIKEEMDIIQKTEQMKIINAISDSGQNSTGRAQLISTLDKLNDIGDKKEGPVFIYTHVPLDSNQEHAENVIKLDKDPFLRNN